MYEGEIINKMLEGYGKLYYNDLAYELYEG